MLMNLVRLQFSLVFLFGYKSGSSLEFTSFINFSWFILCVCVCVFAMLIDFNFRMLEIKNEFINTTIAWKYSVSALVWTRYIKYITKLLYLCDTLTFKSIMGKYYLLPVDFLYQWKFKNISMLILGAKKQKGYIWGILSVWCAIGLTAIPYGLHKISQLVWKLGHILYFDLPSVKTWHFYPLAVILVC